MSYYDSTTWTIGRILDRLHEAGEEVVVYAGHHAHRGVVRAVGEHLLTLQVGDDVLAVRLSAVSSVQLVGGAPALGERVDEPERVPRPRGEVLPARPPVPASVPTSVDATARSEDERIAAEAARRTGELQEWLRQLRED